MTAPPWGHNPPPVADSGNSERFPCMSGYCTSEAVAAVYIHGRAGKSPTIIIRPDHVRENTHAAEQWRCLECLQAEVDHALLVAVPSVSCGTVSG